MNKKLLLIILKRLLEIKNRINLIEDKGICDNLYYSGPSTDFFYNDQKPIDPNIHEIGVWLRSNILLWPDIYIHERHPYEFYSGTHVKKSALCPVSSYEQFKNEGITKTIWDNQRRWQLLDYLIERAEEQVKQMH